MPSLNVLADGHVTCLSVLQCLTAFSYEWQENKFRPTYESRNLEPPYKATFPEQKL